MKNLFSSQQYNVNYGRVGSTVYTPGSEDRNYTLHMVRVFSALQIRVLCDAKTTTTTEGPRRWVHLYRS